MNNEHIIKEFRSYVDGFVECCTSDHETHELLKAVDKLIEEQEERIAIMSEGGWIPINERKPNSCGTYIVARWFIDGCRRKILTDACYFDGSNTWHDDTRVNHSRPYLTDKIVAWMPLPNPPKDGE